MISSSPLFKDPMDALSAEERRRVAELVDQFEIAVEAGVPLSVDKLCAHEPHLQPAVEFSLGRLKAVEQKLQPGQLLKPPAFIGEFEVERQIGVGGSGIVFQCRQKQPERKVAVKVLKPSIDPSEQWRRFRSELNVFSSLQCDGLADVYVTGVTCWNGADCFWIAMELLEGGRIDKYVHDRNTEEHDVLKLLLKIAQTLQAAHRGGVIHCDLKPSNILMSTDGSPHIVDFGVATTSGVDQTTESSLEVAGTAAWMAPELILGDTPFPNIRTDIYSFGLVACRLLTGQHPYPVEGKTFPQIVHLIDGMTRVSLPRLGYSASRDLTTFVERLTERDPAHRYQNMDHVVDDLQRLVVGEPISVRRISLAERSWRWCLRNQAFALLIMLFAMTVLWTAGVVVLAAVKERDFTVQLAASNQKLRRANTELQQQATQLDQRSRQLEELTEQQQRSLVSARLNETATNLMNSDPNRAHQQLSDPLLFPENQRAFAWQILHAQSRPVSKTLTCGTQKVLSICFSNDAKRVAFSGKDGLLSVGNVATGKLLWTTDASKLRAKLCFSRDDTAVYGFARDKHLLCLNSETGAAVDRLLPDIPMDVSLLDLSDDGRFLAAVSAGNELFLVNLETNEHVVRMLNPELKLTSIWFENKDRTVSGFARNGECLEWNTENLEPIRSTSLGLGETVTGTGSTEAFGHVVRVACDNWSAVRAVFPAGTSETRVFSAHGDSIRQVSLVSPDQLLVTMTRNSQLLSLFAPGQGRLFSEKGIRTYSHAVAKDSSRIALGDAQGTVRFHDLKIPSALLTQFNAEQTWGSDVVRGYPQSVENAPGHHGLFVGFSEGYVVELAMPSQRLLAIDQPGKGPVITLLKAKDDSWLAAAVGGAVAKAGIAVYSLDSTTSNSDVSSASDSVRPLQLTKFLQIGRIRQLSQSTDGMFMFAALQDGNLAVIDCRSWQIVKTWAAHEGGVYAMTVADGKIYSAGTDGFVRIWKESDHTLVDQWRAHKQRILDMWVSSDSPKIVTASHDHTAAIWTADGRLVQRIRGHSAPIRSVAVSEDGQTIATGSEDHTIRLWDGHTGAAQMTLRHDGDFVSQVRFENNKLLATTHKGTIEIWGPPCEGADEGLH